MPEEIFDGDRRDTGFQQVHRLCVAERVETDAAPLKGGHLRGGQSAIAVEEEADSGSGELVAPSIREQGRGGRRGAFRFGQMVLQELRRGRQQGYDALLAAFPGNAHLRQPVQAEVGGLQIQEFLDTRSRVVEERQDEVVTPPFGVVRSGRARIARTSFALR